MTGRTQGIAAVAITALAAALLSLLQTHDGEQLHALKADPIARFEPDGAELADTSERNQGGWGAEMPADYRRVFALPPGDPVRQLQAAVSAAEAAGWTIGPRAIEDGVDGGVYRRARKRLPTGRAELVVTLLPGGSRLRGIDGPVLLIRLSHELTPGRARRPSADALAHNRTGGVRDAVGVDARPVQELVRRA